MANTKKNTKSDKPAEEREQQPAAQTEEQNNDLHTVNMEGVYSQPTEEKNPMFIPDPSGQDDEAEQQQPAYEDDFEDDDFGGEEETEVSTEASAASTTEGYEEAELVIEFINETQSSIFSALYKKKGWKDKAEYRKAKDAYEAKAHKNAKASAEAKELANRFIEFREEIADLPYSEKVIKLQSDALARIMAKNNKKLPPEMVLFLSTLKEMGRRAVPLFVS